MQAIDLQISRGARVRMMWAQGQMVRASAGGHAGGAGVRGCWHVAGGGTMPNGAGVRGWWRVADGGAWPPAVVVRGRHAAAGTCGYYYYYPPWE